MIEPVYLLDTNVVLRCMLNDHPVQSPKAIDFFDQVSKNQLKAEIPAIILAECVYVLSSSHYEIPKDDIADGLIKILSYLGIVNSDRPELLNSLIKFKESNCSFPDCVLASMSSANRRVVSFDSDFNKLNVEREIL